VPRQLVETPTAKSKGMCSSGTAKRKHCVHKHFGDWPIHRDIHITQTQQIQNGVGANTRQGLQASYTPHWQQETMVSDRRHGVILRCYNDLVCYHEAWSSAGREIRASIVAWLPHDRGCSDNLKTSIHQATCCA